ncbi:hypothetical protein JRO89_XS02G0168900 [Xanthoceras sorbifolium]|uniref:Retrovirus-related Pol polyprotein from transposon TNT 1-94 n=1 Tax=Xanthoceras sorbifolium TaxID=99658 RepID=A0ABQ8IG77_9ROSI|nr:hypothetical protein JRO89_XS02G0168900 [Xanthoceras sorbifolium]
MLMENFLRFKEYWQVVDSGVAEPTEGIALTDAQKTELEGQWLKDLKAKNYLFQTIDRSILETILSKETSKKIWDSMKKKYQGSSRDDDSLRRWKEKLLGCVEGDLNGQMAPEVKFHSIGIVSDDFGEISTPLPVDENQSAGVHFTFREGSRYIIINVV